MPASIRRFPTHVAIAVLGLFAVCCLAEDVNLGGLTQFPPAFERIGSITAPTREDALRRGYRPGLGLAIVSAGRFGFLKGDGLLDCAYPSAGHIEKAYLAEHPHNRARSKWAISFGPPSAAQPGRARRGHRLVRVAPENVRVNWVSVAWDSEFADQSKYQVTYNTVGPGILIETDGRAIRFGLDSTPGYRNIVLPLRQGVVMRRLSAGGEAYRAPRDGRLTDNWILLRGSSAFPDVPLLLVLKGNPVDIGADLADDGASSLTLRYESRVGHVIAATPFGMGAFRPTETSDPDLLKRSVGLCRFWSKALMAFITDCKECYRVDWPTNSVSILQEYDYRRLTDVWGSRAIPIAPYPPALCLAAQDCAAIKIPRHAVDLAFPTKYGPLRAVVGADRSEYRLPIPPAASRIPIPPSGESPGKREGRLRHRVAAHDGSKPLPRDLFPGFWSRPDRSSVDAACMLGVLAPIWPYLDATSRQALKANAREYLIDCLDDQELFARTALFQSIERTPADAGKLARPIWFERTEPYTRKKYLVSYTVPNVRREGRSVTDYEGLFTDLEWGNGLGLYGIYQMAQLSGDWEVVKRNWQLVKGIYGLFEMLQDWACMSVSGSEHGRRWTDTASYGGYIGFRELARHVGDTEARHDGVYLHAKHGAMRMAMFNAGTYLNRHYAAKPWKVCHSFFEMAGRFCMRYEPHRLGGLRLAPDERRGDDLVIQKHSFYSLVAEGPGYECPDLFYALMPEATSEFVRLYQKHYPEWSTDKFCEGLNRRHGQTGGITAYQMLLFELRDPTVSTHVVQRHFDEVSNAGLIRKYLPPMYRRNLGAQEHALALLETRDDPAWLEDWHGVDILSAEYDRAARQVTMKLSATGRCRLQLGGVRPRQVALDRQNIPQVKNADAVGWSHVGGKLRMLLPHGGALGVSY